MTYQSGHGAMRVFDQLPMIVRRAMSEAIFPPPEAWVVEQLARTRDPHGVAGQIRAQDAVRRGHQQFEIDDALSKEHRA